MKTQASSARQFQLSQKKRIAQWIPLLHQEYPDSRCSLHFQTPFQLLAAIILSAQCTDERVNQVTPALFQRFPDAQALSQASLKEVEPLIYSTGFYRAKAKSLLAMAQAVAQQHAGVPPRTMEELLRLRGVGRKTANVLLGVAYGIPGLVVDTHVKRLTQRMGFSEKMDPEKIEKELMVLVPQKEWTRWSLWMVDHGRKYCTARRPRCEVCFLQKQCPQKGVKKGVPK